MRIQDGIAFSIGLLFEMTMLGSGERMVENVR